MLDTRELLFNKVKGLRVNTVEFKPIIGIDLGTTGSRVAVLGDDGSPIVIENDEGDITTPSHVAVTETGKILIGKAARKYALTDPSNVAFSVKRLVGRRSDDPAVNRIKRFMPFEIIEGPNKGAWVRIRGINYSPEELTAYTLVKMKQSVERVLGKEIEEAVITVPAYFNDCQIQSTRDAAKIAGLTTMRIYAEPTAAAEPFGMHNKASFEEYEVIAV